MGVKSLYSNVKDLWSKEPQEKIEARGSSVMGNTLFTVPFDGEKNLGEIGEIRDYIIDYERLRLRSWQSYLESDITQTILNKYVKWVIGAGLKLQSEPNKSVLEEEGVDVANISDFSKKVEGRFNLYAKSKRSDFAAMSSLNKISKRAYFNAIVGGDVLIILRLVKGEVNIQLIDGQHVRKSPFGSDYMPEKLANGNVVKNGIELSPTGEHIAYYVGIDPLKNSERVERKTKRGLVQAFLLYGREYKLDNHRGLPWIAVVLETLKKMERYKEATVGNAEETAKIVYFIKHGLGSTGANPMNKNLSKVYNADAKGGNATDIDSNELAGTIAATTNKEVFNMENDSTLGQLSHKNNIYFKEFYGTNIEIISACLNIPPDVAMSMYNNSFSASRAALKDWEHTLLVDRNAFKEDFLQYVYDYWFEVQIHKHKINAPGYLTAGNNAEIKESYRACRFVGSNVPHIDPLKEVMAEKAKLGDAGALIPLTTPEMAIEALGGGDYGTIVAAFAKAKEEAEKLGIKAEEKVIEKPIDKDK